MQYAIVCEYKMCNRSVNIWLKLITNTVKNNTNNRLANDFDKIVKQTRWMADEWNQLH